MHRHIRNVDYNLLLCPVLGGVRWNRVSRPQKESVISMIESMPVTYYTLPAQCHLLHRPAWTGRTRTGPRFDGVSPQRHASNSLRIQLALNVDTSVGFFGLCRNSVTPKDK